MWRTSGCVGPVALGSNRPIERERLERLLGRHRAADRMRRDERGVRGAAHVGRHEALGEPLRVAAQHRVLRVGNANTYVFNVKY